MDEEQSFVIVSTDWAIKAAKKLKLHIYKKRMEILKECAVKSLSTPRFIFFGRNKTFTKQQLNKEIYRLWHSDNLDDLLQGFHYWGDDALTLVNRVIKSASLAEEGIMFLTIDNVTLLKKYSDDK